MGEFPLLLVLSFQYKLIQNGGSGNGKLYACIVVIPPGVASWIDTSRNGNSAGRFLELSAARDALMQEG
jgi:hypothetical protein